MRDPVSLLLVTAMMLGFVACGDDVEQIPTKPAGGPAAPAPSSGASSGKLAWTAPPGWESVPVPPGGMIQAQYRIPPAEGGEPVDLKIYWQPGGMGDVDSNLDRWIGMVQHRDGSASARADASIGKRQVHGLQVTTLDISGTYGGGMMGGAHAGSTTEDARLLAAIVEVPGGAPYYIKAVGPASTVKAALADYEKFLDSLRTE